MKVAKILIPAVAAVGLSLPTIAFSADVDITFGGVDKVDVMHGGKKVTIMRNQNQKNTVNPAYAKTSRKCPPFCIQPIVLAPGVETLGEV